MDNLWIVYLQIPESGGGPRISRNFPEFANFEFLQIFVFFCKNSTRRTILKKRDFVQKPGSAPGNYQILPLNPYRTVIYNFFHNLSPILGSPVDRAPNMW